MKKFFLHLIWLVCFVVGLRSMVKVIKVWSRQPHGWNAKQEMVLPLPAEKSWILLAVGDSGTGDENQLKVAQAMERRCQERGGVEGVALLGDLFYENGVSSAQDPLWDSHVFQPYGGKCLSQAKLYPTLGNHDYRGSVSAWVEKFQENPRWWMPGRFYTVLWPDLVRLISFDSEWPDAWWGLGLSRGWGSLDFLWRHLSLPPDEVVAPWLIVATHRPLASASLQGPSHSGQGPYPWLLRRYGCRADIWLSGHAHHLEHRVEPGCHAQLVVVGGGGGLLQGALSKDPESLFAASQRGFLELEVFSRLILLRFFSEDGLKLYETTLKRPS